MALEMPTQFKKRSFLNWRPGADEANPQFFELETGADEASPQFFEPKAGSRRIQTADETDNS